MDKEGGSEARRDARHLGLNHDNHHHVLDRFLRLECKACRKDRRRHVECGGRRNRHDAVAMQPGMRSRLMHWHSSGPAHDETGRARAEQREDELAKRSRRHSSFLPTSTILSSTAARTARGASARSPSSASTLFHGSRLRIFHSSSLVLWCYLLPRDRMYIVTLITLTLPSSARSLLTVQVVAPASDRAQRRLAQIAKLRREERERDER